MWWRLAVLWCVLCGSVAMAAPPSVSVVLSTIAVDNNWAKIGDGGQYSKSVGGFTFSWDAQLGASLTNLYKQFYQKQGGACGLIESSYVFCQADDGYYYGQDQGYYSWSDPGNSDYPWAALSASYNSESVQCGRFANGFTRQVDAVNQVKNIVAWNFNRGAFRVFDLKGITTCSGNDRRFNEKVITKDQFNMALVGDWISAVNDLQPTLEQLHITYSEGYSSPGWGNGLNADGSVKAPTTTPSNPTSTPSTPTSDPYGENGSKSRCGLTDLNAFQYAVAYLFHPCEDWASKFSGLSQVRNTKKPFGYVGWFNVSDSSGGSNTCAGDCLSTVGLGNATNIYGNKITFGFNIEGHEMPALDMTDNNLVVKYLHEVLRPILSVLLWASVIGLFIRRGLD